MKPALGITLAAVLFLTLGAALFSGSLGCTDRHVELGSVKLGGC